MPSTAELTHRSIHAAMIYEFCIEHSVTEVKICVTWSPPIKQICYQADTLDTGDATTLQTFLVLLERMSVRTRDIIDFETDISFC